MSVAGFSIIWAERINPVDYTQELPDGQMVYHVGGMYQFMLREA